MRKYSLQEIDQMRANLQFQVRDNGVAEDQLRTYMLNGTYPVELAYASFELLQEQTRETAKRLKRYRIDRANGHIEWMVA